MSRQPDDDFYQERASEARKKSALVSASREERFSYRPILEAFRKPGAPIPVKGRLGAKELARREGSLDDSSKGKIGRVELSRQETLNGSSKSRHKQANFQLVNRKTPLTSDYLSAHFSLDELTFSDVAIRNGIENSPDADQVMNLKALTINVLEPARLSLGAIKINSGFRAPALNKLVGGSPTSQHMLGEAADIRPLSPIVSMAHLYSWLSKWVKFGQLIWEFSGAWVHVSHSRTGSNQGDRLVSYLKNGVVHYRPVVFSDNLS